ncbi:hypothetical protein LTR78_005382 [Recurvomyces mirabilis]|uniref:Enoyl reductase (ER) domain-containing protein n=1 Tax=Recurvomyces mirabilis TaxID=574656 RepID=A0AAE0WMZ1_9PEZI|nr:hypothetical protein LTR78_005382 [Recurvomyces mirabilis]KAK5152711.1 hypothetical protein LTS14_008245 [Recurvomyces mirabilis]
MSGKHQATVLAQKGGPISIQERTTPKPGSGEYLVEVKAVAFNPIDYYQRDFGLPPINQYPTVLGGDVAGTIAAAGSRVENPLPQGSRVLAGASAFFHNNDPDYGAFQRYVLVPWQLVTALPDKMSFEEGAVMPLAVMTALTAYTCVDIPLDTRFTAQDKQGYLVWGASSSVGTYAVQVAKSKGYTVYATASAKHHDYIKGLGADHVFAYQDKDVVDQITSAVKKDDITLTTAQCVVTGSLEPVLAILKATKGDGHAKVTHTPVLPPDHPTLENTTIKFNFPPIEQPAQNDHYRKCFQEWLAPGLRDGTVVSSPPVQHEGNGLEAIDKAIDAMRSGVSCKKIVVTL